MGFKNRQLIQILFKIINPSGKKNTEGYDNEEHRALKAQAGKDIHHILLKAGVHTEKAALGSMLYTDSQHSCTQVFMPKSEFPYNSTAVQMFLQFRGASVDNM